MPLCTPAQVEMVGALTPSLFKFAPTDQASLDAIVEFAIVASDAWMQDKLGSNYNLTQFPWQIIQQQNGQIYLSLEKLTDTLKAQKIYGTHFPYMSEESPNYEALINNEWGVRAMEALDRWVTVESASHGFALPIFETSQPLSERGNADPALVTLDTFYAGLLDRARGISLPNLGTVTR